MGQAGLVLYDVATLRQAQLHYMFVGLKIFNFEKNEQPIVCSKVILIFSQKITII